jgi:UDP-N-acetylmuramoyl-L-alanyl-D-glutamate--2,6-diaminopimelate ligase
MQTLSLDDSPLVVIDYAHTPDAIEKALLALQAVTIEHGGQLWCVMGCGGERDQSKRALMGAKAQSLAQRVVLTSDNPRHEDPLSIVAQIKQGLKDPWNAVVEIDRRQAILRAIQEASSKDVILIAGKGHENYQDILGVKHEFSDARVALESLGQRALRPSAGVANVNAS